MFDMSWGEVMVIGTVALVVIGPKDLPKALRTVGQMTAKVRRMASEFQSQFNEAMREAELDDVRKQIQGLNSSVADVTSGTFDPVGTVRDELKTAIEAPPSATASTEPSASEPAPVVPAPVVPAPVVPAPDIAIPPPAVPAIEDPARSIALANALAQAPAASGSAPAPEPGGIKADEIKV